MPMPSASPLHCPQQHWLETAQTDAVPLDLPPYGAISAISKRHQGEMSTSR